MDEAYINTVVKLYYDQPIIAEAYGRRTDLQRSEIAILDALRDELSGARLLDIGVGAGRTTPYLRALSDRYTGIDYSDAMLRLCRERHPDAELLHCDARALPFADASHDAAFIFWNALDDVDHDDRMRILAEAHRVLRDGGPLIFSSHNRGAHRRSAFRPPSFAWSDGVARSIERNGRALLKYLRGIINHCRSIRHERRTREYAILNDQSYSYGLLAYYIDPARQREQLESVGFELLHAIGADGLELDVDGGCDDPWIYYVARKRG